MVAAVLRKIRAKLARQGVLSSLALTLAAALAGAAAAHEVRPAVADATVSERRIVLDFQAALEPLVAGMDLDGLQDTNESPLSGRYDALRALDGPALEAAFRAAWPDIRAGFAIKVGGAALEPRLQDVAVPPPGDTSLPRISALTVTADLPTGDTPVRVGWDAAYGPLVLRQQASEGAEGYAGYLTSGALSEPLPRQGAARQGALAAFADYVAIGFAHIVPLGLDHILFVLGLFFFSLAMRPLLVQVTAFTAAHTVTLALATLGIVTVPASIVEPLIAASIVFVAVENLWGHGRLTAFRTAVVFGFGLLHGLGFASVLGDIGLDPARFVSGLIAFNIGVELGQLAVILVAWLCVGIWFGDKPWYRARIAMPASVAIALVGAWWLAERTVL